MFTTLFTTMQLNTRISFLNRMDITDYVFKNHTHDCYEIVYLISGNGTMQIGDKHYDVSDGSYGIISPDVDHVMKIDGPGNLIYVGFDYDNIAYPIEDGVYTGNSQYVYPLIWGIIIEHKDQLTGFSDAAKMMLDLIIISISRLNAPKKTKYTDLGYVKCFIEEFYHHKISFTNLAETCGYSYDYFRHIFKEIYGVSPQEHLMNVRLKNAYKMLKETSLSCTDIADQCVFSNNAQFSAMFKKRYGITPQAVRKSHQS